MTQSPWMTDLAEEAARLYDVEGVSAAVIARRLNADHGTKFTRLSVMGKLNRMGLIGRGEQHKPKTSLAPANHTPDRVRPVKPQTVAAIARADALKLEPLGPVRESAPKGTCQFMTGMPTDPDWRMCGRPGFPWCEAHRHVVVDKVIPAVEDRNI